MTYHLESLGPEEFQKLCQAILVATYPDLQCLPIGQPDGGRDAIVRKKGAGFVAYQVKYARDPSSKDERLAVEGLVKSEKSKVDRLIKKGAKRYVLMTNVSGTSHLDVGSIDRVNEQLSAQLGIESICFWRDDIERRIDANSAIKWSFPQILRATDLIETLIKGGEDADDKRRAAAIRSYVAYQFRQDSQLKFKQIELQKTIVDLFVDVPAKIVAPPFANEREHDARWRKFLQGSGVQPLDPRNDEHSKATAAVGALELLLQTDFAEMVPKVVVEGAPGQGKSTVTQYLCQVHRLRLLRKDDEWGKVQKEHRPQSLRMPFRIDLRDYATWLAGRNPFDEATSESLPAGATRGLESFIAAQVHAYTGAEFSVDDLLAIASRSRILLVLDGFDEVADPRIRNAIVEQVSVSADRLATSAVSSQIIVTSRPSAFANSPGFPQDEWQYVEILSLTRGVVQRYAERWLQGRNADPREKRLITSVLNEKLQQPHVRDLARNPMQLAILLALITVQGESLPNKRTALYDRYVDIFFNRESEKSEIVRDHRELLVQIHQFLAWKLHSGAEHSGSGNIAEAQLKECLRQFLAENGHQVELVDTLFTGMVERVVALVSRIQGTFEFEVQPLREYFAARYLYDTAPYAPPGKPKKGTLPDRFNAIARNFYWLNVTRFYAGCYSSGELSSLIDGIDDLEGSRFYRYLAHTPQLGLTLLSDYVFNQQPKLATRLAQKVVQSPGIYGLLGQTRDEQIFEYFRLPDSSGRAVVLEFARQLLAARKTDLIYAACRIIGLNCGMEDRVKVWKEVRSTMDVDQWLLMAEFTGVATALDVEFATQVAEQIGTRAIAVLARARRYEIIDPIPDAWAEYFDSLVEDPSPNAAPDSEPSSVGLEGGLAEKLGWLLWPYLFGDVLDVRRNKSIRENLTEIFYSKDAGVLLPQVGTMADSDLEKISSNADAVLKSTCNELLSNPDVWSNFIESCRSKFGLRTGLCVATAAFVEHLNSEVLRANKSIHTIFGRIAVAKSNSNSAGWWIEELDRVEREDIGWIKNYILCLFRFSGPGILVSMASRLSSFIDRFTDAEWQEISQTIRWAKKDESKRKYALASEALAEGISPRVAALILQDVSIKSQRELWRRVLREYKGSVEHVHDARASMAILLAIGGQLGWDEALSCVSDAYGFGAHIFGHIDRTSAERIPVDVAEKICKAPPLWPITLCGTAAGVLAGAAGTEVAAVSLVASRDGWFAETFD